MYSAGTFKGLERIANNALQTPSGYRQNAPAETDEYLLRLLRGTPSSSRTTASPRAVVRAAHWTGVILLHDRLAQISFLFPRVHRVSHADAIDLFSRISSVHLKNIACAAIGLSVAAVRAACFLVQFCPKVHICGRRDDSRASKAYTCCVQCLQACG